MSWSVYVHCRHDNQCCEPVGCPGTTAEYIAAPVELKPLCKVLTA